MTRAADLADFENPPVKEVAISVTFAQLSGLRQAHIGAFWERIKDVYIETDDTEPVQPFSETLKPAPPSFVFQLNSSPPVSRTWFKNADKTRVFQIQSDRLICNWQDNGGVYPHFESVYEEMDRLRGIFTEYASSVPELGEIVPQNIEVVYVNKIDESKLSAVLTSISDSKVNAIGVETEPHSEKYGAQFLIKDTEDEYIGRLYLEILQVELPEPEADKFFQMTLTFRSLTGTLRVAEDVWTLCDEGRNAIVRTFTELTEPELHIKWGRKP